MLVLRFFERYKSIENDTRETYATLSHRLISVHTHQTARATYTNTPRVHVG